MIGAIPMIGSARQSCRPAAARAGETAPGRPRPRSATPPRTRSHTPTTPPCKERLPHIGPERRPVARQPRRDRARRRQQHRATPRPRTTSSQTSSSVIPNTSGGSSRASPAATAPPARRSAPTRRARPPPPASTSVTAASGGRRAGRRCYDCAAARKVTMPRARAHAPPAYPRRARRLWLAAQRLDTDGAVRRRPRRGPRRGRASRLCPDRHDQRHRALAPPYPAEPDPGLPPRRPASARSASTSRCSNTGPMRSPISRPATPLLRRRHEAPTATARRTGSGPSTPPTSAASSPASGATGRCRSATSTTTSLSSKRPPLGQPQAVEARLAARLLRRPADDQRPRRHGEDLRAHRPPLRLAAAPAPRHRGPGARLPARPRAAVAGRRQPRLGLLHGRAAQARDGGAHRGAGPPPAPRAGRDRRRGKPRTGPRRTRSPPAPADAEPRVHLLSPFDPLVIQRKRLKPSSATTTASRPTCRSKSDASATSRCRCWSATASPPRSTSRPTAPRGTLLIQQWTWIDGPRDGDQARIDAALGRFEALPVRRLISRPAAPIARAVSRSARPIIPTSAAARIAAIISAAQICTVWP